MYSRKRNGTSRHVSLRITTDSSRSTGGVVTPLLPGATLSRFFPNRSSPCRHRKNAGYVTTLSQTSLRATFVPLVVAFSLPQHHPLPNFRHDLLRRPPHI